jgi:hypothetical protein
MRGVASTIPDCRSELPAVTTLLVSDLDETERLYEE